MKKTKVSLVIPVYNEENSIAQLVEEIENVFFKIKSSYEIILIDDGSTDHSWLHINTICSKPNVVAIKFRKNLGKAYALNAGFAVASGNIIITMDADLQDDPAEIPRFIKKMEEGYDLVSGWKQERKDPFSKTIPSKIFNNIIRRLFRLKINDINCGFKAYKSDVVTTIDLYGDLHRFIPILAEEFGYKIAEIPVKHRARKYGKSKYGFTRFFKGLIDLLTVIVITKYLSKPAHFFGSIGFIFAIVGASSLAYLFFIWLAGTRPIGDRPLFLFGVMMVVLSVQLFSTGVLAEIFIKNMGNKQYKKYISESTPKRESNI